MVLPKTGAWIWWGEMQAIMGDAWGQKKWPDLQVRDIFAHGNQCSPHADPQVSRPSLPVSHKAKPMGKPTRK